MYRIGHKRARDLIVRFQHAGLDEDEFTELTGRTFASAAMMDWEAMERAYERIAVVDRDRAAKTNPPGIDAN